MAFTTEFVMGAGGSVEEIPVSMSGSGNGTVYPIATVDAGDGAWVWVDGERTGNGTQTLNVGSKNYSQNSGTTRGGGGGYFTGNVAISIVTTGYAPTTFTGKVYVTRM